MVDYAPPSYQFPARKAHGTLVGNMSMDPHLAPQNRYGPQSAASSTHSRRRTSSSGVFPEPSYNLYYGPSQAYPQHPSYPTASVPKRRTDSTSTGSASSMHLRRADSTNTTASAVAPAMSNYVATLRRQKATVWCDRSQPEDPRLLAAQKEARIKAAKKVTGSSTSGGLKGNHGLGSGSSSTASLRGAGRTHHKLGKGGNSSSNAGIGAGNLVNRPPPRLSATEANGDSSDEEELDMHRRSGSGSGRSSLNSNHRTSYRTSTVYSGHRSSSYGDIQRRTSKGSSRSYSPNISSTELAEPQFSKGKSKTSPHLISPHILEEASPDVRMVSSYFESPPTDKAALKRRGSVDEGEARTMTMSGLRLVVANPD